MKFFLSHRSTVLMAVIYVIFGFILMIFPEISGTAFCWILAAASAGFSITHLLRYYQGKKVGFLRIGSLILGVIFAVFALVCALRPDWILSFLPLVLGIVLIADATGKIPHTIDIWKQNPSLKNPTLFSCLIPLIIGVIIAFNPFQTAKAVIFVAGLGIAIDGGLDVFAYFFNRNYLSSSK